jgi:signal transduction histidine kinase
MQEARGTAQALREGVTQLKSTQERPVDEAPPVETMLDALDGAIEMLGVLESNPLAGKDRRGRIDIAALLFGLAPEARISLEPGAGTEVFGVESDLRRMLGVLLGQPGALGSNAPSGISIRREGDWIRISVELGPEGAPRRDLESRWLSRMALRQGGRVELERGKQSLLLPADRASEKREIEQLRKELEQAQQLGAVYARELAEAFSSGQTISSHPPEGARPVVDRLDALVELATPLTRALRPILDGLRADSKQITAALGESHNVVVGMGRRISAIYDLLCEIDRLSKCEPDAPIEVIDLSATSRTVTGQLTSRADRAGVKIELSVEPGAQSKTISSVVEVLLYSLVAQAISATVADQLVKVSVTIDGDHLLVSIEDGGPIVPESAFSALQKGIGVPQSLGRPAGLAWLVAGACAERLGTQLNLTISETLRSEVRVFLPRVK